MIHTNMPRNCMVFILRCEKTRSAILWISNFYSTKWPTVCCSRRKVQSEATCFFKPTVNEWLVVKKMAGKTYSNKKENTTWDEMLFKKIVLFITISCNILNLQTLARENVNKWFGLKALDTFVIVKDQYSQKINLMLTNL